MLLVFLFCLHQGLLLNPVNSQSRTAFGESYKCGDTNLEIFRQCEPLSSPTNRAVVSHEVIMGGVEQDCIFYMRYFNSTVRIWPKISYSERPGDHPKPNFLLLDWIAPLDPNLIIPIVVVSLNVVVILFLMVNLFFAGRIFLSFKKMGPQLTFTFNRKKDKLNPPMTPDFYEEIDEESRNVASNYLTPTLFEDP